MNEKIGVCIPYFGTLPKNMVTYLLSCKYNKNITFFIFTNDVSYKKLRNICTNVIFIKTNLSKIKQRIIHITGLKKIVLPQAYKLCDYRPLYGEIFSKYLRGYDYWGYADLDVVYGNLMPYIKYGIIHHFKKIGDKGHFTLFHNDYVNNNRYKLPIKRNGKNVYLFKDIVSKTANSCSFDEWRGINIIFDQYHIRTYRNPNLVNDILFPNLDVTTNDIDKYRSRHQCFIWDNGVARFFYTQHHKIKETDYGYFHFQKRRSFINYIDDKNTKIFSITTYGYNKLNSLNMSVIKQVMESNKSNYFKRLEYKLYSVFFTNNFAQRLHIGKLRLPVKYLIMSVIHHNFRIFKN